MLELDGMEKGQTECALPIVVGARKDGTLQSCMHYRKLNSVTVQDSYPTYRMDECIDWWKTRRLSRQRRQILATSKWICQKES